MKEADVCKNAFAMPLTSPAYPIGPLSFRQSRISRSSPPIAPIQKSCARSFPSPCRSMQPIVKYEFIRMPDSTGFGDYTETRTGHSW